MKNIFQKKPDVKEEVRNAHKINRQGVRDIEKELRQLDAAEKKLLTDIKLAAKKDAASARILAKELVRLREHRVRLRESAAHIKSTSTTLTVQHANMKVAQTMGATGAAMAKVNEAMNPAKLAQDMAAFARTNAQMDMAGDMMNDALDDIFDAGGEEEADDLMNQVLDEMGIDVAAAMPSAGFRPTPAAARPQATQASKEDADVDALLASLKA